MATGGGSDYPVGALLLTAAFLLIAGYFDHIFPSFIAGLGPYASGYVSEFVWGGIIILIGLGVQALIATPYKDLVYYLAPLVVTLGFFALSFALGILSSFARLPVGGTYTGGEGFIALFVLVLGNDIAHYVFRRFAHNRFS